MPNYTVTIRWLNPATHVFEPVQVRGLWDASTSSVRTLTYRDVYYTPDPVPDSPIIVTARLDTRTSATVEWMDGQNTGPVQSYSVYRNGVLVASGIDPSVQTFSESGLATSTPELIFVYTVLAITDSGPTPQSDGFSVQWNAPVPTRKPFPPSNLVISQVTDFTAHLAWQDSTDGTVLGHRVYRNGNPGILLADNLPPEVRSYDLTGLLQNTAYTAVNVRRFNSLGESQASNFVNFTTSGPNVGTSQFPGHQAGLEYLGVYSANAYGTEDTPIGTLTALDRIPGSGLTTGTVDQHVTGYYDRCALALIDGKMPWISLLPTHLGLSGSTDLANWNAVIAGTADAALEQYFEMIATLPSNTFTMLSFHPKPSATSPDDASAAAFCAANEHIGLLWETFNAKENGIYGPILDSEYFDAVLAGTRSSAQYVNEQLLSGSEFLGIDLYQNNKNPPACFASTRLNYVRTLFAALDTPPNIMMAVGEFAGANVFRQGGLYKGITITANSLAPTGSQWLAEAMSHFFGNKDKYFALSAFDTSGLTNSPRWALDEAMVSSGSGTLDTQTKMAVYQGYISGTQIARQQGGVDVRTPVTVTASLNKASFAANEQMTLTVTENVSTSRTAVVTDTAGTVWTKQSDNGNTLVYTGSSATAGTNRTVTVKVTRTFDHKVGQASAVYATTVINPPPPPGTPLFPGHVPGKVYLGWSTAFDDAQAETQLNTQGPFGGNPSTTNYANLLGVRRLYSKDNSVITRVDNNKRMLWISGKGDEFGLSTGIGSWPTIASGSQDSQIRSYFSSLVARDVYTLYTFHHEPIGNAGNQTSDPDNYVDAFEHIMQVVDAAYPGHKIIFGPNYEEFCIRRGIGAAFDRWLPKRICPNNGGARPFDIITWDIYQYGALTSTSATAGVQFSHRWWRIHNMFTGAFTPNGSAAMPYMRYTPGVDITFGIGEGSARPGSFYNWENNLGATGVQSNMTGAKYARDYYDYVFAHPAEFAVVSWFNSIGADITYNDERLFPGSNNWNKNPGHDFTQQTGDTEYSINIYREKLRGGLTVKLP